MVAFKSGAERRALVEPCRVSETRNPATQSNCGKFLRARSYQVSARQAAHGQGNDLGYGKNARDWIIRSEAPHCSVCARAHTRAMANVQRLSGCGVPFLYALYEGIIRYSPSPSERRSQDEGPN